MLRSWLRTLRDRLIPVDSLRHEIRELKESSKARRGAFHQFEKPLVRHVEQGQRDAAGVADRVRTLEHVVTARLDQQEVMLRRLEHLVGNGSTANNRVTAHVKPIDSNDRTGTGGSTLDRMAQVPTEVRHLDQCPICGGTASTVACEWNKFLLMGGAPDANAVRYDYSICHDCGVLAAWHHPVGQRFRYLIENFVEATGKEAGGRCRW